MTQTVLVQPVLVQPVLVQSGTAQPGTAPAATSPPRAVLDGVRAAFEGTPGRLRLGAIACVLACLGFALLGASAFQARAGALADARADADQLVLVQGIAADIVSADSAFTNGYLTFGQESKDQVSRYTTDIDDASSKIAKAAAANPADAADLEIVNQALGRYQDRVAAARANNRQGFQVATGYLRQAITLLGDKTSQPNLLPTLEQLAQHNADRVDEHFAASRAATWRLAGAGVGGLVVLLGAQLWLSRRTHRLLNLPLATATGAVAVALLAGGIAMASAQSNATKVNDTSYAATRALADAQIAAYTAKSAESISLIYIGTGGGYAASEKDYATRRAEATDQLAKASTLTGRPVASGAIQAWDAVHAKVYTAALADWVPATRQATSESADSVNGRFKALTTAVKSALDAQHSAVDDGLGSSRTSLLITGWLALVLGLLAAVAAWWGFSLRLEEYR